jgi:hypothetical protein
MYHVPDPIFLKINLVALGIESGVFGSVTKNSDHTGGQKLTRNVLLLMRKKQLRKDIRAIYSDVGFEVFKAMTMDSSSGEFHGGDAFLRTACYHKIYAAPHPRRQHYLIYIYIYIYIYISHR